LNSPKMEEIKINLSEYQEQTKQLKAQKASVEAHEAVKERAYNETANRIRQSQKSNRKERVQLSRQKDSNPVACGVFAHEAFLNR
jgi:hypothetical protein